MSDHPNAARRRAIFEAYWVHGDVGPMLEAATPDYVWRNDIGAGPWRRLDGTAESIAFSMWWSDFFGGTFRHELIDICASDDRVVEVLREVGEKDGHVFDNVALYVYDVAADGRFSGVQTFDRDRDAVTKFWSHYPEVMVLDVRAVLAEMTAQLAG